MKSPEQAIQKVLSALGDAETSQGMERRILTALRNHESHSAPSRWHRLDSPWLIAHARIVTISAACGLAAVVAATLMTPAIRHQNHAPAAPAQSVASTSQPLPKTTALVSAQAPASNPIVRRTTAPHPAKAPHIDAEESLAEAEMRAPSQPAPPLPLTQQEQLLLRLVHASDPVELASLDSKAWAAQFARSKAQFDKFFAPPKTDLTGDQQ